MTHMADLNQLRQKAFHEMRSVLDTCTTQKRDLTVEENTRYAALEQDLNDLDEKIGEHQESERRVAESEAKMVALGRGEVDTRNAKTWLPSLHEYRELQHEQRAVGTTGAFIPVGYTNVYFDLLRKRTALLDAGPMVIETSGEGSIVVPKVTSAVTVGPIAENAQITPSDPGLGSITLDPKKFAAMTLVAREALEDSSPELRTVVSNSLIKDTAVELDRQLMVGSGSGGNILGLRNVSGVTAGPDTGTNGGSLSLVAGYGYLADTLAAYEAANCDPDRAVFFMHSRTFNSVRKLVDSQGRPIVTTDVTAGLKPLLFGKPVYISNNLPINETKGTGTTCSSIILADMSEIVVATSRQVELMISTDFKFDTDEIALRVTARYDLGVPQPTAVTITTGLLP